MLIIPINGELFADKLGQLKCVVYGRLFGVERKEIGLVLR